MPSSLALPPGRSTMASATVSASLPHTGAQEGPLGLCAGGFCSAVLGSCVCLVCERGQPPWRCAEPSHPGVCTRDQAAPPSQCVLFPLSLVSSQVSWLACTPARLVPRLSRTLLCLPTSRRACQVISRWSRVPRALRAIPLHQRPSLLPRTTSPPAVTVSSGFIVGGSSVFVVLGTRDAVSPTLTPALPCAITEAQWPEYSAQDFLALSSVFPLQCNQDWKGDGVDFPGASWGTAGLSVHTATPSRWDQLTGLHLSVSERGSLVAVVGDSGRASGGTLTPHGACVQERSSVRFSPG